MIGAMTTSVCIRDSLGWREVDAIAHGASLELSAPAEARLRGARAIVESIVAHGIRAYGVNTGVGALCDTVVDREDQGRLSRSLIMSHAIGVGPLLSAAATRAIIAAAVNNHAHGYSGIRPEIVHQLQRFLNRDCVPNVPSGGSVGYLTHMAHVGLVVIGEGMARVAGRSLPGLQALREIGAEPQVLEAKDGLSLVNGTPCATGLAAVALARIERMLQWADAAGALTFEVLRGQMAAFAAESLQLRRSASIDAVGANLRRLLAGSELLEGSSGDRTQDPLSLRAIPQVHGAARDVFETTATVVDSELSAVTDNPVVAGTVEEPQVHSEAHAVGAALALALDSLAIAVAATAAMSERRVDRLVNPLVSGLPPFLSAAAGVGSGLMIAQYTVTALTGENRRLAAPATLDGGSTSAQQEDHLCHPTPAALKLLRIAENFETVLAVELLAAAQAHDLRPPSPARAPGTAAIHRAIRGVVEHYRDDRPLADDLARVRGLLAHRPPQLHAPQ